MDNEQLPKGYKNTEVGVIPEDWEVKEFGQICYPSKSRMNPITSDSSYKCIELEHLSQGTGFLLGYANSKDLKSQKSFFEEGDVLFGKLRPYLRKFYFADFKGVCTTEIWVLKPEKYTSNRFLFHLVRSDKIVEAANLSTGTKMPRAEWKTVSETKIPVPTIEEQTAIATALSDADALINSLEKLIAKKRNIKQGAMQQLLKPKEGWEVKKLGEIAEVRDGTHQTPTYVDSGIPFYSVESVTNNDFRNTKYITEEAHKLLTKTCKIEKGDILMTRIGSIGDCKLIDWDVNASFYVSLALLKIKSGYSSEYIYHYSKTAYFKKEADINSLQSAIPKKINLGPISNIKIEMPEYDEQIRIATILSDMDAEIQALETKLEKYRKIKLGMMQNLLTGKIRLV